MNKSLQTFKKGLNAFFLSSVLLSSGAFAQSYSGSTIVNGQNNMGIDIKTYPAGDSVTITMTGPSNVWFGFGFGGSSMNGTYAIINEGSGNVSERKLGNHNSGSLLASSFTSSSTSVAGGVRTTIVKRTMTGMGLNYYTFPSNGSAVTLIWAYGFSSSLNSHTKRGATALSFILDCSNAIDVSVNQSGHVLTANEVGANYRWLDCNNAYTPIQGETNQTFTASMIGDFAVEITSGSCTDTSACYNVAAVGLNENLLARALKVYPNPANGMVTVDLANVYEDVTVVLMDLSGRELFSKEFRSMDKAELLLDQLPGVYVLHIFTESGEHATQRLMLK